MVYEVFVYPFTKIGHHVSVTKTKDRVGAAPKREGWGGRLYNPPEAACHTSPTLQNLPLTLVRLRVLICVLQNEARFSCSPSCHRGFFAQRAWQLPLRGDWSLEVLAQRTASAQ